MSLAHFLRVNTPEQSNEIGNLFFFFYSFPAFSNFHLNIFNGVWHLIPSNKNLVDRKRWNILRIYNESVNVVCLKPS